MRRPDALTIAVTAAFLLCAAFIASFIFGLSGTAGGPARHADTAVAPGLATPHAGRLEVLNASGRAGMARAATDRLRLGGFDVVHFGNAPAQAGDSSIVLVRVHGDAVARAAARHLGIARLETRIDTTLFVDATVVIGRDWPAAPPPAPAEDGWRERIGRWVRPGR